MPRKYKTKQKLEHAGAIRQSQLISTFGIGAMVDFVKDTVIVAGVDDWDSGDDWQSQRLFNHNLQAVTGREFFLAPKTAANASIYQKSPDVESHIFPYKLYCPACNHIVDASEAGNQQNKHNCFMLNEAKQKPCGNRLVPSRFVIVCSKGHIEDFPYSWWVHKGKDCTQNRNPRTKMYNFGDRSDIDSLRIECVDCGMGRNMVMAFSNNSFAGYGCQGRHPHLGKDYAQACDETMIARLRTSSSVYFPSNLSALTIPPWSRMAVQEIEKEYVVLSMLKKNGMAVVEEYIATRIKKIKKVNIPLADLLAAFVLVDEQKASHAMLSEADLHAAEYNVLCSGAALEDDYVAHAAKIPEGFENVFDVITIVDKLAAINTLIGFTRLEPWDGSIFGGKLARLSRSRKDWLPAVKLLGEGIFFKFSKKALDSWSKAVSNRYSDMARELNESHLINDRFSSQYVALHTFAHLLIRQLSNDCGYSASSIKEKIYSTYTNEPNQPEMGGVLIYLATSDKEGSLGGLISIASDPARMGAVLRNMLHKAIWCSADPLCQTSKQQGYHSLNYAACHDCVLLPETSCEFRNVLLDRISVVGRPENPKIGLMGSFLPD